MATENNIKIIKIRPTSSGLILGALATMIRGAVLNCQNDGYTNVKVCINKDDYSAEIHALKEQIAPLTAPALPTIEVLPSISDAHKKTKLYQREANLRKTYNRIQNTKFGTAARNYKGRKR